MRRKISEKNSEGARNDTCVRATGKLAPSGTHKYQPTPGGTLAKHPGLDKISQKKLVSPIDMSTIDQYSRFDSEHVPKARFQLMVAAPAC